MEIGLIMNDKIVPWNDLSNLINFHRAFTPVMACYSGINDKNNADYYIGYPITMDAEFAGVYGYGLLQSYNTDFEHQ